MLYRSIVFAVVITALEAASICDLEKICRGSGMSVIDLMLMSGCNCGVFSDADESLENIAESQEEILDESRSPTEVSTGEDEAPQNVKVQAAGYGELRVTADPPSTGSWHRELHGYYLSWIEHSSSNSEVNTTKGIVQFKNTTEFILKGLKDSTDYTIYVTPYNSMGLGRASKPVVGKTRGRERPDPPTALILTPITSRSVNVQWSASSDVHSPITNYTIQYRPLADDSADNWDSPKTQNVTITPMKLNVPSTHGTTSNEQESGVIDKLQPGVTYVVRVLATNSIGTSQPSDPVTVTTAGEPPSQAPQEVKAQLAGLNAVRVTWVPPAPNTWNGELRGYHVVAKKLSSSNDASNIEINVNTMEYVFKGLEESTQYSISIAAFNDYGPGPTSCPVVAMTLAKDRPDAPTNLTVKDIMSNSMILSWKRPFDGNSPIKNYTIQYNPSGSGVAENWESSKFQNVTVTPRNLNDPSGYGTSDWEYANITNLHSGVTYAVRVFATNSIGSSQPSDHVIAATPKTLPSAAPRYVRVVPAGRGRLRVTWAAPPKNSWNGELLGYRIRWVQYSLANSASVRQHSMRDLGNVLQYTLTGLEDSTLYDIQIAMYNSNGDGPFSIPVDGITEARVRQSNVPTMNQPVHPSLPNQLVAKNQSVDIHQREPDTSKVRIRFNKTSH
ncbi:receptor-type tyrosine-protein phosphatase F isoform X2 [Diachasma alloeum]|uniref:receptor-type tyrosine-protein phosphatase F isoform X2 n=1 Tax=Diachasma alloeum TaxID=454923 RepID=UPI0007382217|nr:receptor-type tyrosine-protein phosphatase F isoform X2 [Diachasma alloeum]